MKRSWPFPLACLLATGFEIGLLGGPAPATGATPPGERIWAELFTPRDAELVREPIGLVEVRGWAGTGLPGHHDVVIAIDRSSSTWAPSGVDIDGDDKVGRFAVVEAPGGGRTRVVTDPGDSIAQAELLAARRLIERLDSATTRMGIVTFAGVERVPARIGASRAELLDALAKLPDRPEPGGTYYYGAIIASMKLLKQAPLEGGSRRHRSIILLSDGLPTAPPPRAAAEQAAVRAAEHASNAHITIYSFALGPEVAASPRVFREIADVNGGELMFVESPGDIIDFVPHMSLTKLKDVEIVNLTAGQSARAVRLFPDGTFDGFAPLVDGLNRLRIDIYGEGGGVHSIELEVQFEKTTDAARLRELLDLLRARTMETELAKEARRKRDRARERTLQIEVDR